MGTKIVPIIVKDAEVKSFTSKAGKEYQKQMVSTMDGDTYWLFYNPKFNKPLKAGDSVTLKGEESDYTDKEGNKTWNWKVANKTDLLELRIADLELKVEGILAFQR